MLKHISSQTFVCQSNASLPVFFIRMLGRTNNIGKVAVFRTIWACFTKLSMTICFYSIESFNLFRMLLYFVSVSYILIIEISTD